MTISASRLPEIETLRAGLESALEEEGLLDGDLTIVSRRPNVHASTFLSEVVTCRIGSGSEIQLFCKYSSELKNEAHGHRGGVEYEAKVYRQLLNKVDLPLARFIGEYQQPSDYHAWLVLKYLRNSMRVTRASDPKGMINAARWIGEFHANFSAKVACQSLSFIRKYDAEYYTGWARRTSLYAKQAGLNYKWLETICDRFDEVVAILSAAPATIIHGEYYPKNILFHDGEIYPVDWESAALAPGEIDLASLTEGWGADDVRRFELEYEQVRWPEGVNYDFRKTMCAARIYLRFRWLGERPEWTSKQHEDFEALHRAAEDMSLL